MVKSLFFGRNLRAPVLSVTLMATSVLATPAFGSGLPPEQQQGSIRYVTGGVGQTQSEAFIRQRSNYPLAVEIYARQNGQELYTASTDVAITNAQGERVLQAEAQGPFLLAEVPPGSYTVEVTRKGQTQRKQAVVSEGRHAREVFVFQETESGPQGEKPAASNR